MDKVTASILIFLSTLYPAYHGQEKVTENPLPIRMAVVGDSISAGNTGHMEFVADEGSWAGWATAQGDIMYAGGYAEAGRTSTELAGFVRPVSADVLVMMAGTNNFHTGIGWEQHRADMIQIAQTISAPKVVIFKLPPIDYIAEAGNYIVEDRNVKLEALAAEMGWGFIDPWAQFRNGVFWKPGCSDDGVHPKKYQQIVAGNIVRNYLNDNMR